MFCRLVNILQSNSKVFLFVLFSVWLIISYATHDARASNDIIEQLKLAKDNIIIDWKPPLESWLQLQFYKWSGDELSSFDIHYFLQLAFYGIGICLIAHHLGRYRPIYILSSLTLLVLNPWFIRIHIVGNDALFIGVLLCSVGVYLNTYDIPNRWIRYSGVIITLVFLVLSTAFRLNGLPAILILLFILSRMRNISIIRSLVLSVFVAITLTGAVHIINYHLIKAQKSYPLNFLYVSDMMNVSILKNEWSSHYHTYPDAHELLKNQSPQSFFLAPDNINFTETPLSPFIKSTDEQHSKNLQEAWLTTLKDNPKEVTIVRLYAFQLFLFAGRGMWFIDDWIYENYPGTNIFLAENHRNIELYITPSFFLYSGLSFVIVFILILLTVLYLLKKRMWLGDDGIKIAIALSLTGVVYLCTFIPFTLSATELRYFLPHCTLFTIAISIFVLYVIDRFIFKTYN